MSSSTDEQLSYGLEAALSKGTGPDREAAVAASKRPDRAENTAWTRPPWGQLWYMAPATLGHGSSGSKVA
jgi:hypothetical protein